MDDERLIRGTLAGCREDFEALVERYQKMLYAFAYRFLQDADAADEAVQATFVQAYRNLSRFRGEASFTTWLHQIALNQCRSQRRAAAARREVPLEEAPEAALADDAANPGGGAARGDLARLVTRLPPRQRAVLSLRVFADLPFREVARIENISENSAKVSYHNAVKRLRQWISSQRS